MAEEKKNGGAFEQIFPIGLGTGKFQFSGPGTYRQDFERAVELVLYALDRGVNYIDVGPTYSNGHACAVLKEAFRRTDLDYHVTVKVNVYDPGHHFYQQALSVLDQLGLERASHFLLWTLMNREQYERAIRRGSLYDAALRLREEGRIRHIGASVHMSGEDTLRVIDSGLFEFVLVSYNLVNFMEMQPVLDRAYEKGVDILVMNPLYGGLIPRNAELFEYARASEDETPVQAAVRAVLAHPAVKCVLAGASDRRQLDEYLSALDAASPAGNESAERVRRLEEHSARSRNFCSGCRYCADCPADIPVPDIMNARNFLALQDGAKDSAHKLFCKRLRNDYRLSFETSENPCVRCGRCERRCTKHLDIIRSVQETYEIVGKTCSDDASRRRRFDELINGRGYRMVGFWPASFGTKRILDIYRELFGEFPFEAVLFDSNSDYHGTERFGYPVYGKEQAAELGVDCILITSYQYREIIREQIQDLEAQGIDIRVLYRNDDLDWCV